MNRVAAQITDPDHPLQGEPVLIQWDDGGIEVSVRINGRWWPIQIADAVNRGDAA